MGPHDTRVTLVFYDGTIAEHEAVKDCYTYMIHVPERYNYVRIAWPNREDAFIPVETLIRDMRYIGFSQSTIDKVPE